MKIYKKFLTLFISVQLLTVTNPVTASETVKKRTPNAVLKVLQQEIDKNESFYFPERYAGIQKHTLGDEVTKAHDELIAKLEDTSFNFDAIKQELIVKMELEEQTQLDDFRYVLKRMTSDDLDKVFKASMKKGIYPEALQSNYDYAFNMAEKREVVMTMMMGDLQRVKSATIKRIGMADRAQLIEELKTSDSLFRYKNREWKNIVIVVLTLALAGFASWAIMSSIKKSYAEKTEDMHDDFDQAETDLEEDYRQRNEDLLATFEERARLREEGYVWQICSTTSSVKTASCSFDYKTHSGLEICQTRCLKNPTTGEETMHSTSCSSAYIPSNCFLRNQYDIGWDEGYEDGYDNAYYEAYQRAYDDAYSTYYSDAYSEAYGRGYDYGYSSGYSDGLSEAEYDDTSDDIVEDDTCYDDDLDGYCDPGMDPSLEKVFPSLKSNDDVFMGYKKGYREGYAYATSLLTSSL